MAAWVGPYVRPIPIRCRGGLHFYRGEDPATSRGHVVVMAPYLASAEARTRLEALATAHRRLAGPAVPDVSAADLDAPSPWVALDCDGVADLEVVVDYVRHGGDRPAFAQTASLGKMLMETLARCHGVLDPVTAKPTCLGSLSTGNVLVDADGRLWLVGFGAGPLSGAIVAPEVQTGSPLTPGADVYAVTMFLRSHMSFTRLPSVAKRIFAGRSLRRDARLVALFAWSNLRILAGGPPGRPTMDELLGRARSMWDLLGFEPDVEGFTRFVVEAVAGEPQRLASAAVQANPPRVVIRKGGEWLETPDGSRHALGRRGPLRRVLLALAEAQGHAAGRALSVDELLRAGWPGERPLPEAANNRVWVTISMLRKLGLGEVLQRWDGGYRLDPAVPCLVEAA